MEFFFCNNDMERCIKGTKRKWIQSRPDIPSIWPVKIGTNLSKKEILDFESAGFQLPQHAVISPRRLFGTEELPFNLASFPTPASGDDCPKTKSGKSIRRNNNAPSTKQANNCASALTQGCHADDNERTDGRTMAAGASVTWTHCSVLFEVTWVNHSRPCRRAGVRADG
jgi:hypothetical protein